ncbi:MAG: hypothetical protein AB7K24_12490 [Gemmataceae bacterium]
MLQFIKRLLGLGDGWLGPQRENLRGYLQREFGPARSMGENPVWTFAPYVALWSITEGWAITDEVLCFHVIGRNNVLLSARDAVRYFARHFRESAASASADGNHDIAEALRARATALLHSVSLDEGWPEPVHPANEAEPLAQSALKACLASADSDPLLTRSCRMIHERMRAPGGLFHGLYFFLDFQPGQPAAPLFDALARQLLLCEERFAPLVAWRVQYALVALGVNFGESARELDIERQGDQMRARHAELSQALDRYSPTESFTLAMHFVDSKDVPFTAHPISGPVPGGHQYKAEETFFDVRTHSFHQSLEKSDMVGMRLLAGSIAPEVIRKGRRAFARA